MGILGLSISTQSFSDLILALNRQKSHHYQMLPIKSTVLNKGWRNSKGRGRTGGGVRFLSWDSVQLLLKRGFVGLLNILFKWFIWGGGEGKFLLINSLWQLLCSFNISKLLNKLGLETEKKIRSSAVIWHPILSLFPMTCPLTRFIMSVTFKIRVQSTNFQCSCALDFNMMSLLK